MSALIEANSLCRWFGQVMALNDLSVSIAPGITGLFGANGAGKTTFMRLLCGLQRPSSGSVRVFGADPFTQLDARRRIGYSPADDGLYDDLSGAAFVKYTLELSGFERRVAARLAMDALDRVGLADAAQQRAGTYSKGMRQRLRMAQAIAHTPELLVLDEPMDGLDPLVRVQLLELLRGLAAAGSSILISTHIFTEVEALTDRMVVLGRGRLLACGSVAEVRALQSQHPRKLRVHARNPRSLARELLLLPQVVAVRVEDDGALQIETRDLRAVELALPELARSLRPGITAVECLDAGMDAVFGYLAEA